MGPTATVHYTNDEALKLYLIFFFFFIGEPQEECARCGKTFLMPANASGGDVTGLCSDCCGDVKDGTDTEMEADDSADGDVDVDIHDQD